MKKLLLASAAALWAPAASAGGIDQSGQPISLLFRDGDYAEAGFGYWLPALTGVDQFGTESGNVYGDVSNLSTGVKKQINERWSVALLIDQPWGVNADYPANGFAYAGTFATVDTVGVTGLVRYRIDPRFSLHGGVRASRIGAGVGLDGIAFGPLGGYEWSGDRTWGAGYVLGAAYEIPDIALRVVLTYSSETRHEMKSTENVPVPDFGSTTEVTMPQSVNLDFQTGVSPRTLVYGSVRWVNWKDWTVAPEGLALVANGLPLVQFDSDAFTYKLGVGRQFTAAVSGGIEVAHETAKGGEMTALSPYDGYTAVGVGATYAMASGLELTGGVAYNFLGDAPDVVEGLTTASFENNHSVAAAVRIGYHF